MVKLKEGEIEVVRKAALAYFTRSTPEIKQLAHESFNEADDDGNGRISQEEYLDMLDEEGKDSIIFFEEMDKNGDGSLDFHEFLTLSFANMFENGFPACGHCENILVNIYFSCNECHLSPSSDSYDLCADCYRRGKFSHSHKVFYDNLTLLKRYKSNVVGKSEDKPGVDRISLDSDQGQMVEKRRFKSKLEELTYALRIGAQVAQIGVSLAGAQAAQIGANAAQSCTIM